MKVTIKMSTFWNQHLSGKIRKSNIYELNAVWTVLKNNYIEW